jgi:hypothetical protein
MPVGWSRPSNEPMRRLWRDPAIVAVIKVVMGAAVLAGGFSAVSDDDFARIVHAQQWALNPTLDPTGTSWLPLPFWLNGGMMAIFGTDVIVARVTAFILGVIAALLIYAAARVLFYDRGDALLAGVLAAILPWSARLGVATVPELPTAALGIFGIATLHARWRSTRILGALALMAACLSRYEAWPLAAVFAAYCAFDARRSRGMLVPAAIAIAGPLMWILHNAIAHGSALHFVTRVSDYKHAVGGAVVSYPLALVREEPELFIFTALLAWGTKLPRSCRRAAVCIGAMMLTLLVATAAGGAPTHHAGRALLVVWLAMAIYVAHGARGVLYQAKWRPWFTAAVLLVLPAGAFVLRPWYAQLDSFIHRDHELTIGRLAAKHAAGQRILVEVIDYSYFAIQAGGGDPSMFVLDRTVDPRNPEGRSSFTSADTIRARANETGSSYVVARQTSAGPSLGPPLASAGPWSLWRAPASR